MMADESDDDFVSYGTCLEPIEDATARPKPILLEDQVVTDKQGRRRFHGAFTGGFSAGYFNSVGTKEGWTPSTFASSRGQTTGGQSKQRAEDFMDDEDLGDFGIAPRKIVTTEKFTGEEEPRKRPAPNTRPSVIPGEPPLQDLIVPNNESVGARLLRKMGWRHGQGVGPKLRRRKKKSSLTATDPKASGSSDENAGHDFYKDFLFAPTDVEEIALRPKDDRHGIGYRGLDPAMAGMGQHVSLFEERPVYSHSGRRGIAGQAFGVGAFETADDDIYGMDSMVNYDRVLGGEEPGGGNYGWTAPKEHSKGSLGVLENFKASAQRRPPNKMFPPPVLPRDFRPFHTMETSSKENEPPAAALAFKSSRFTLSATQRGAMLGEEQLPGPSSVFDFLSLADRQKLQVRSSSQDPNLSDCREHQTAEPALGRFHRASSPVMAAPTASDPQRCQALGGGFKPFASDAAKQQRYEAYLDNKRGGKDLDVAPSSNLTEWERQREREEFGHAASLYQPLKGLMATRFVSAKNRDDEETVDVPAEEGGDKSEQAKAAELKMFGKLTRDSLEWYPDNLLCKRFNIPNPYPGSSIVGLPTVKKDKFSVFNFLTIAPTPDVAAPPSTTASSADTLPGGQGVGSRQPNDKSSRWDKKPALLANVGVSDSSVKGDEEGGASSSETTVGLRITDEPETESRPPMDLFKAIFASSSSSSNEDEEEEEKEDGEEEEVMEEVMEATSGQAGRQEDTRRDTTSSPTGMFSEDNHQPCGISTASNGAHAPLTYDRNQSRVPTPPMNSGSDSEVYGPSLPPPSSIPVPPDSGVKGRNQQQNTSGEHRRSKSHRKEKRRKKQESRSTSRHKHSKDKKHKSKKRKKMKQKSKMRQGGHQRSSLRSGHGGHSQTTPEFDYDASGSSGSSSSSSEDNS